VYFSRPEGREVTTAPTEEEREPPNWGAGKGREKPGANLSENGGVREEERRRRFLATPKRREEESVPVIFVPDVSG